MVWGADFSMKGAWPGLPPQCLLPAPQPSTCQGHRSSQVAAQTGSIPALEHHSALRNQPFSTPAAHTQTTDPQGRRRGDICSFQAAQTTHTHTAVSPILPQNRQSRAQPGAPISHPCSRHRQGHGPIPGCPGSPWASIPGCAHPSSPGCAHLSSPGCARPSIPGCSHLSSPTFAERHGAGGGRMPGFLGRLLLDIYTQKKYVFPSVSLFLSFLLLLSEGNRHIWAKPVRNQRHSEGGTAERRKFLQFQSF